MTVSTANIWKSAATARQSRSRDNNLHIGQTLRDLYFDEHTPKTEGRFSNLLDELDEAEKSSSGC